MMADEKKLLKSAIEGARELLNETLQAGSPEEIQYARDLLQRNLDALTELENKHSHKH